MKNHALPNRLTLFGLPERGPRWRAIAPTLSFDLQSGDKSHALQTADRFPRNYTQLNSIDLAVARLPSRHGALRSDGSNFYVRW